MQRRGLKGKVMTKLTGLAVLLSLMAIGGAHAGQDYPFLDELTGYAQRIDTLSVASGDARNVNAATQIIDPWPRYARDRRIPANGQRMVGAINRYQNPRLLGAQAPTLAPIITQSLQGSSGGDQGSSGMGYGGGGQ
jgi:hypothetical protein